jgi:mono/diheme cytochrome c family protein
MEKKKGETNMEILMNQYKAIGLILCFLIISLLFLHTVHAQEYDDNKEIMLGKEVYNVRCALCHGSEGNGKGPAGVIRRVEVSGRLQTVHPWDFTMGVFRFRSTPSGCMPRDEDLLNIISNGIPISLMPAHEHIPLDEKKAIVAYVKTLSDAWEEAEEYEDEESCQPIPINKPEWVGSPDSIAKGEVIYKKMKCWECHGHSGAGDGPKATDLKDDWGRTMLPFNFTSGELKRGSSAENVYVTFSTGLDGTGMPSYLDSLDEDKRWHLVSYTLKLMKKIK